MHCQCTKLSTSSIVIRTCQCVEKSSSKSVVYLSKYNKQFAMDMDEIQVINRDNSSFREICRADFIDPNDLLLKINTMTNYLVIDVRPKNDYNKWKIDCECVNVPPEEIDKEMASILVDRLYDTEIDMYEYSLLLNWNKCELVILIDWDASWKKYSENIAALWDTLMRQPPQNGRTVVLPRIMILEGGFSRFINLFPYIIQRSNNEKVVDKRAPPSPTAIRSKRFKAWNPDQSEKSGTSFEIPIETTMKSEVIVKHHYCDLHSAIIDLPIFEMSSHIKTVLHCICNTPHVERALVDLEKLKNIIEHSARDGPRDAHVFFRAILKTLHFDLMTETENKSCISDLFFGTIKRTFTCNACGMSLSKYQDFQTLTVPRDKKVWTKDFGLVDFIAEIMQERCITGFRCKKCGVPRKAVKKVSFSTLPQNIVFHLDRIVSPDAGKNLQRVDYPFTRLNLDHYKVADVVSSVEDRSINYCYNLYAMIRLDETQNNNNSFSAYCKSPSDMRWRYYQEKKVYLVRSKEIKRQKFENYLLFYRREIRC